MNLSQSDIDPIDLPVQAIKLSDESIQREGRIMKKVCSYLIQLRNKGVDPVYALRDNNTILGHLIADRYDSTWFRAELEAKGIEL